MKMRGQEVDVDKDKKEIRFTIEKPLHGTFSVSDTIQDYINFGYTAIVSVDGQEVRLNKYTTPFRKEDVRSKFPGAKSWSRFWYSYHKEDKRQMAFA